MATQTKNAKEIFVEAIEQYAPSQWPEFLTEACGNDTSLRKRVEILLKAHIGDESLLDRPAIAPAQTLEQPTERLGALIGPYKLLEQIGEGGMGLVYMAEQQRPMQRLVALKLIKPGMDSKQVIARFEAEKQALAMMDHENIAKVHDAGTTEGGRPYFVMELVRGIPVNEFCDQQRLTVRQRLELFIQVCQAVQHAHQKGIIHRDLKPTNVLVTKADTVPLPKVIDFGIAKALGSSLTDHTVHTGFAQLVGTPMYMSPEQAEMNHFGVDTRSDVYSLGVLLYELLTGTPPFDKETLSKAGLDEMRRIIREEEPETVSARIARTRNSELGARNNDFTPRSALRVPRLSELDWIVMKSLEKDRSRRYESASALATDIQRYLSDEPVLACPPTTMYRFQKFARKHKPALATAAAIAACLILGTTVSAWQAIRATAAEGQAATNEARAKVSARKAEDKTQEATTQRDEVKTLNDKLQHTLYIAHMNMARHAWEAGAIDQMAELLEEHRPRQGESDLRGLEWHYLYRLAHSDLLTLKGHTGGVTSVVYSPDGKRLASASSDKTIKVWDAQTGRVIRTIQGHTDEVLSVAFSPDGKRLASASHDKTVKVWDAQTGQELLTVEGHSFRYNGVAFSPDGKHLASASRDKTVKVWDAQTGQELLTLKGHRDEIDAVAYSPDGKMLASASGGSPRTVKVWDTQSGEELLSFRGNSRTGGDSVAFSADSKRMASSQRVWNVVKENELFELKERDYGLSFSPDGKHLAGSAGRLVTVCDAQTGKRLAAFKGHADWVNRVAFSPDGKRVASASIDGTVKIWDATATSQEGHSLGPKGGEDVAHIRDVAYSPDGKRVAIGSVDRTVKVFDVQTGLELLSLKGHTTWVFSVAYSPDGKRLASTCPNDTVKVWDAQTGQELLSIKATDISSVAFSPDGKCLASSSNGALRIWDAQSGQEILALKGGAGSVAFSPDGKRVAGGSEDEDNTVKIWDAQTGQELLTLKGHSSWVRAVAFSPDGKRLASGEWRGKSKVWDAQTGQELLTLTGHSETVLRVVFSPDGKRLASAALDNTVKVWDAQTGKETLTLKDSGYGVAFSPDGQHLVGGGEHGLKIYDATPLPEKP